MQDSKYEITLRWVLKNQKYGNFNTQIERYFVIKIRPSPKV